MSVATPEQLADYDLFLDGLNAEQAAAVRQSWKLAQTFGYKSAALRVWDRIPAPADEPKRIGKAA